MSKSTEFLQLFKYDPVEDGMLRFNITTALNENWDKLDAAIGNVADSLERLLSGTEESGNG